YQAPTISTSPCPAKACEPCKLQQVSKSAFAFSADSYSGARGLSLLRLRPRLLDAAAVPPITAAAAPAIPANPSVPRPPDPAPACAEVSGPSASEVLAITLESFVGSVAKTLPSRVLTVPLMPGLVVNTK